MARILQLLESTADFQTRRGAEVLGARLGPEFGMTTRSIGPGGNYVHSAAAAYRLRRLRDDVDVVHAYGTRALTLAAMTMPTRVRLVYTPPVVAVARTIRWLGAVMAYRAVEVVCPTATLRRMHVERGIPIERTHLIRPGVDFGRVNRRRSTELRKALGFGEEDRVLLAVGEHTHAAHHVSALWAAGILHVLDARHKVLLWGRGPQAGYLARFTKKVRQPELIGVAERELGRSVEFEELMPAADVAVVSAVGSIAPLPVQICMGAAIPIVSSVTSTTGELLEDRHTALMTASASPKLLAKRVRELQETPGLQWRIADQARAEAYEYFPLSKFVGEHRAFYEQVAAGVDGVMVA